MEVSALQRRVQLLEEDLEKTEERLNQATTKLNEASQAADESERYWRLIDPKKKQSKKSTFFDYIFNKISKYAFLEYVN